MVEDMVIYESEQIIRDPRWWVGSTVIVQDTIQTKIYLFPNSSEDTNIVLLQLFKTR